MNENVFFLDTEFVNITGRGSNLIELLSIGVVRGDGFEYYAQNANYTSVNRENQFVRDHVYTKLEHFDPAGIPSRCGIQYCIPTASGPCPWKTVDQIAADLSENVFPKTHQNTILTDGGAHDIILLTAIFRGYEFVPDHIPRQFIDHDIIQSTFCRHGIFYAINERPHHALFDARALRDEVFVHKARCKLFSDMMEYTLSN